MVANRRRTFHLLCFVLLLACSDLVLTKVPIFQPLPRALVLVVLSDFILLTPFLVYWVVLRRKPGSMWRIIPVELLGLRFLHLVIPRRYSLYLNWIHNGIVFLEVLFTAVLIFFAIKYFIQIPAMIKYFKRQWKEVPLFLKTLRQTFVHTFGEKRWIDVIAEDLSMWYYCFFSWKKKKSTHELSFSFHKTSGYTQVLIMLLHLIFFEAITDHLLIRIWSSLAAWLMTLCDLQVLLYLIADYRAVRLEPLILGGQRMHIQKGIRGMVSVDYSLIKTIQKVTRQPKEMKKTSFNLTPTGSLFGDEPQFEMLLKDSVTVIGLFGIKKNVQRIYIKVDEPDAFLKAIQTKIA